MSEFYQKWKEQKGFKERMKKNSILSDFNGLLQCLDATAEAVENKIPFSWTCSRTDRIRTFEHVHSIWRIRNKS